MSTGSIPATRQAPAGFPLAIRDYLKRTALLMEIENHKKPFFPHESKVVEDAHLALYDQISATFPAVDVFVCVVLRKDDPETHVATAVCSYSDRTGEITKILPKEEPVLLDPAFEVYRYLRDAVSKRTDESGRNVRSAITGWLGEDAGHFYIAPYVVTAVEDERIESFRKGDTDARIGERFLPPLRLWTDLLHTVAFAVDSSPTSTLPALRPAYFTAAMLVGVRDWGAGGEPYDLATILEVLFIQYQLAWSFPTLIDQRKRQRDQEDEQSRVKWEQKRVALELREKQATFKVVEDIADDLTALSDKTKVLRGLLDPFESPLLARYKLPGKFISDNPPEQFYDWLFEHDWPVALIRNKPEHFRQQFACVLMAYCAPSGTLPDRLTDRWPLQSAPAILLQSHLYKVPGIFRRLFDATIAKVIGDGTHEWTGEDEIAFRVLKAAFFNAFKHGQRKLTGPLLALWAEDNDHALTDETLKLLTNNKSARDGDGWCRVEALVSLHQLIELHRRGDTKNPPNASLRVTLSPLGTQNRSYGAKVQIMNCQPAFVQHVESLQTPSDADSIGVDEYFGNLNKAVTGVLKWCKPMKAEIPTLDEAHLTVMLTDPSA